MAKPTRKRERRDQVDQAASDQAARTHDNIVRTRPDHPGMDATLADVLDADVARDATRDMPEQEKA